MQEMLLIALVVLLFFGGKKIPELMKGLGKGVRSFKEGMNNMEKEIEEEPVREILPKRKEAFGISSVEKKTNPLTCNRGKRPNVNGSHYPPPLQPGRQHACSAP